MAKKQQLHRAGTVIVLGTKLRRAKRPLCVYYARFRCVGCDKLFTSSMAHVYDPYKYPLTRGVGYAVTPAEQRPRWHDACRAMALRSPLLKRECKCGCGTVFETRMPHKVYFNEDHRKVAAAARRPAAEPTVVFELTEAEIEALAIGGDSTEADLLPEEPEADLLLEGPELLGRRVQSALEALGKAEERLAGLLAPTQPAALQQVVNEMSALTRERAEVDAALRGARPGPAARLQVMQKTLLKRHAALMEEKTLLQQEEADRLDARRRDASDAVDRCREALTAAREEKERQYLRALALDGDEEVRARLRS